MSIFKKYLAGWTFRTSRPNFDVGEEIRVTVNEFEDGRGMARIGDSKLYIDDCPREAVDMRVMVDITDWDTDTNVGEGTYLETVSKASF